jgi:hypothetical protein
MCWESQGRSKRSINFVVQIMQQTKFNQITQGSRRCWWGVWIFDLGAVISPSDAQGRIMRQ